MAVAHGYSKIITSGLTYSHDTSDVSNSYLGRPTTNVSAETGLGVYNNVGGDVSISLTQTSNLYRGATIWVETITPTTSTGVSYLTNANNPGIGVYTGGGGGTANRYTGHSIFFKPTVPMSGCPCYTHYSNIGGWQSSCDIQDMGDGWYRAKVIWYDTVTRSDGKYWAINPLSATLNAPITIYWAGPFKEDLNSSSISTFTNGTRSATQGLLDLTRKSTVDLTYTTFSNSTANILYDGVSAYTSVVNSDNTNPLTGSFTIIVIANSDPSASGDSWDLWVAKRSGGSNGYYVGANHPSGVRFMLGNDASSRTDTGFVSYTYNTWAMYTAVLDRSANTQTIIKNNYQETSSTTPSGGNYYNTQDLSIGGDKGIGAYYVNGQVPVVLMYNRALTQAEIVTNYNHYKTRFGLP